MSDAHKPDATASPAAAAGTIVLGGTLTVNRMGFGAMRLTGPGVFGPPADRAGCRRVLRRAVDLGVDFIDTADSYGGSLSEQFVGQAVAGRRHELILATKTGLPLGNGPNERGLSYARVISSCEQSLRRLGTDYIDLYYLHHPGPLTPLGETLRAFDDLARQGKVRYVGISNHPAWQVCQALWICDRHGHRPPVVSQNAYNLLDRSIESQLLPFCRAHSMGVVPYFPLASGLLTGKYRPGEWAPQGTLGFDSPWLDRQFFSEHNFVLVATLCEFAHTRGHTIGELAIAWPLAHSEVTSVIAGATKPEQVAANFAAVAWRLSAEELKEIGEILV